VPERPQLVVITGMSGAGRSQAGKALEDLGFFVIDNLPATSSPGWWSRPTWPGTCAGVGWRWRWTPGRALLRRAGAGAARPDHRRGAHHPPLPGRRRRGVDQAVRREPAPAPGGGSHPERVDRPGAGRSARAARQADVVVDTSDRSVHELRETLQEVFAGERPRRPLRVAVTSFGFKHGCPGPSICSSTCASCPTRTGCPSSAAHRATTMRSERC